MKPSLSTNTIEAVQTLLAEAEEAIRAGWRQQAYQLSLRATQVDPHSVDAWYMRASLADSLEERMLCVNRLNELAPEHSDKHDVAFFALKEFLDREPFLAYHEETEALYRVENADGTILSIPKRRATTISFPNEKPGTLTSSYRWLMLAVFGLIFAGLGTVIFAPLAIWAALNTKQSAQSHADRVGVAIVSLTAAILFLIGLVFTYLFIIHLIG